MNKLFALLPAALLAACAANGGPLPSATVGSSFPDPQGGEPLVWAYEGGAEPMLALKQARAGADELLTLRCDTLSGRMLLLAPMLWTGWGVSRPVEDGGPMVLQAGARFEGPVRWLPHVQSAWPGTRFDPTTAQLEALARADEITLRLGAVSRRFPAPPRQVRDDFAWKCADALRLRRPAGAPQPG